MAQIPAQTSLTSSCLLVLCFVCASPLKAEQLGTKSPTEKTTSEQRSEASPAKIVVLGSLGDENANERTLEALRAQLSDLRVALKSIDDAKLSAPFVEQLQVAKTVAHREQALLVLWLDSSHKDTVILFISHPASDRLLVREISTAGRNPEGTSEAIAVIVRASAKALMDGHEIGFEQPGQALEGIPTQEAPTSPQPEVPARPLQETSKQPGAHLGVSLGYGIFLTTGDAAPFHGPTGRAHLRFKRINISAGYQFRIPNEIEGDSVNLSLSSGRICAAAAAAWALSPKWRLEAGLEAGLTFVFATSTSRTQSLEAADSELRWLPGIAPRIAFSRSVLGRLSAYAAISVDVLFKRVEYVAVTSSGNEEVLGFWRFQPFFEIGLIFFDFVRPNFVQDAR